MVKKIKLADKWNRDYITITEYKNGTVKVLWDSTGDEERMGKREYEKFRRILEKEGIWRTVSTEHRDIKHKKTSKRTKRKRTNRKRR